MNYNVTNYSSGRTTDIQNALFATFQGRSAKPDIFIGQEFLSSAGVTNWKSAMNTASGSSGTYSSAAFIDGPDTDSALIYRSDKVVLDRTVVVATGGNSPLPPRNILRYDMHLAGYGMSTTFSVYSSHMKAGTTSDDMARRLLEAQIIRDDAQTLGHPFISGGDYNIQSSNETSFSELTGSQTNNLGRFFDPIKTSGTWNNSSTYRFVHTQDPWSGGAGMDDRFDFVLLSSALIDGQGLDYIGNPNVSYSTTTWNDPNHSYRSWGNDGTSFNTPLTVTNNAMVGPVIAQALINATGNGSGHLPVFLDLKVPAKVSVPSSINFGTLQLGQSASVQLTVTNSANTSLWTAPGIDALTYSMTATLGISVPGGTFNAPAGGFISHTVSLNTSFAGPKQGVITVSSDDPDNPVVSIPVSAYVLPFRTTGGNHID